MRKNKTKQPNNNKQINLQKKKKGKKRCNHTKPTKSTTKIKRKAKFMYIMPQKKKK